MNIFALSCKKPAARSHFAFRGRWWAPSVLSHYAISPMLFIPQESTCERAAQYSTINWNSGWPRNIIFKLVWVSAVRRLLREKQRLKIPEEVVFFWGSWSVARGKRPHGAIPDGGFTCSFSEHRRRLKQLVWIQLVRSLCFLFRMFCYWCDNKFGWFFWIVKWYVMKIVIILNQNVK